MGLFGGSSEARQKAKRYEKLEKKLGQKLNDVEMYYTDAETGLSEIYNSLKGGPGDAEGNIMTDLIDKVGVWNTEYQKILTAMQNAKMTLSLRKQEAGWWKVYWEMQAELEEMKGVN